MKVVDVAEFYAERGGGVKTYIHQKLEAGARLGHEVVVIAPGPRDAEEDKLGGRIVWVKSPPMPLDPRYYVLWNERAVHCALDREKPDVVEGSSPWSGGWFAARWRAEAGTPSVRKPVGQPREARPSAAPKKAFIFHQDPVAVYPQTLLGGALGRERVDRLFGPYWGYLRTLSRRFDHTVVAGEWLADKLRGFGLDNAIAVPFGIDKSRFSPTLADPELKARWLETCGVPRDVPLVVAISRHHPEKRLFTLLDAFERARRQRELALVVFGTGPLEALVKRRARKIPGVHIAGFTDDRTLVARTLASADAFLHGSAAETYGLVVAEALCSGLPLVVPDVGGAADLARPAFSETYPAGDARACAEALSRLLARPRAETSRAALAMAAEKIGTMEDHFRALFSLYATA